MTLIKFGAIITDARGKVGGQVLSRNIWGNTLTNKARPKKAATPLQSYNRNRWQFISRNYTGLGSDAKAQWAIFASNFFYRNKLGDLVPARANVVFNQINTFRNVCGLPLDTRPGDFIEAPALVVTSIDAYQSLDVIEVFIGEVTASSIVIVSASPCYRPGQSWKYRRNLRQIATAPVDDTSTSIFLGSNYIGVFGELVVGTSILFKFQVFYPDGNSYGEPVFYEGNVVL